MTDAPTISVVIPYYNGSRFIGEALASVRGQTLAPLEILVVDDGSRPEEAAALDAAAEGCLVVHLPRNRGVSVARNTGIARARGDWIAFLDCDDLWDPRKLEVQARYVTAHPDCRAVHCGLTNVGLDGSRTEYRKEPVTFEDFLEFPLAIFPSAAMMRRDALLECGLFDPALRCTQDLALFMRFCLLHGKFHAVPEPLMIRRVQKEGISRNVALFWDEAERTYRGVLSLFADRHGAGAVMREIHTDMLLRAAYLRDGPLARRIVGRATRGDVGLGRLLGAVLWRALRKGRA